MNSRDQFEQTYCEAHQIPLETFSQYRMGESYREPLIAKCWRFWRASRESIVVDLHGGYDPYRANGDPDMLNVNDTIQECRESIEAQGLRVKS